MTFSPGPASFIRGRKSASPSNTRGGSRVPEWGPLGSVRGAHVPRSGESVRDLPNWIHVRTWPERGRQKALAAVLLSIAESTWIGGRAAGRPSVPTQYVRVNSSTTRVVLGDPVATIRRDIGKSAIRTHINAVIRTLPLRRHYAAEDEQPSNGTRNRCLFYYMPHVNLLFASIVALSIS